MWYDEINKKINDAEKGITPAYNDKAWKNMELLLDEHLPLKKKRRRFILLLAPLVLGGTIFFFILQKQTPNSLTEEKNTVFPSAAPARPHTKELAIAKPLTKQARIAMGGPITTINSKNVKQNTLVTGTDKSDLNNIITPAPLTTPLPQKAVVSKEKNQADTSQAKNRIPEAKPPKAKTPTSSKLSLTFSAGPDISSVDIENPGKLSMQYGLGISYALSKRFSIRTGFYAGRKKYGVDSADYHSTDSPDNLESVDANCLVYEIPVNLVYNFGATKKHNWFISGGVSSYLMKEETYGYSYKNSSGQPLYYAQTYRNESTHLFSIINLSGGYQYHFTDRFSIMAEPYIKVPGSGIGVGKVKFNSAGMLFTVDFKPFLKGK